MVLDFINVGNKFTCNVFYTNRLKGFGYWVRAAYSFPSRNHLEQFWFSILVILKVIDHKH